MRLNVVPQNACRHGHRSRGHPVVNASQRRASSFLSEHQTVRALLGCKVRHVEDGEVLLDVGVVVGDVHVVEESDDTIGLHREQNFSTGHRFHEVDLAPQIVALRGVDLSVGTVGKLREQMVPLAG